MEPTKHSTTTKTAADFPFRMTLSTRGEAYCPVCGYCLNGLAVILLAIREPDSKGFHDIGAVCSICYKVKPDACLDAVATLTASGSHTLTEHTYGVAFYSPHYEQERGYPLADVLHARHNHTPLPHIPHFDSPPPDEPRQQSLFEPYDPPCPADVQ